MLETASSPEIDLSLIINTKRRVRKQAHGWTNLFSEVDIEAL